jgi:hypothetical protein
MDGDGEETSNAMRGDNAKTQRQHLLTVHKEHHHPLRESSRFVGWGRCQGSGWVVLVGRRRVILGF